MPSTTVFIVLDSFDPRRMRGALAAGHLPNLQGLIARGRLLPLDNGLDVYPAEGPWAALWTGLGPQRTGYWSDYFLDPDYTMRRAAYDFAGLQPFFALRSGRRVAVIDPPQAPLVADLDGVQLHAYGAHSHMTRPRSVPAEFYEQVVTNYGRHPALDRDQARPRSARRIAKLTRDLVDGCNRRARLCADLLRRQAWDLFVCVFGEAHPIAHWAWHVGSESHPLHAAMRGKFDEDPWLSVARAIDRAVGEIAAAAPPDAGFLVMSQEGMEDNGCDLPSNVFLPELLYRQHSGRAGLTAWRAGSPSPVEPPIAHLPYSGWVHELWRTRVDRNPVRRAARWILPPRLSLAFEKLSGTAEGLPRHPNHSFLNYRPSLWYSPGWSQMKFIALPSGSNGGVRLNLRGREANGVVAASDYEQALDEAVALISGLVDARSRRPLAKRFIRTRSLAADGLTPTADLVVVWHAVACDVADHPLYGRIGPLPFERTGGHTTEGFLVLGGAAAGLDCGDAVRSLTDLAPLVRRAVGE